jgi:hypothetical protein
MKPAPFPVFDGTPVVIPPDEHSRRIHEGVKAGALAGERRELEQQVHQLEKKLPPSPKTAVRRNRASALRPLTAAEQWYVSPHRNTAAGARNSAADLRLIQTAHDAVRDLGATCTVTPEGTTDVEER